MINKIQSIPNVNLGVNQNREQTFSHKNEPTFGLGHYFDYATKGSVNISLTPKQEFKTLMNLFFQVELGGFRFKDKDLFINKSGEKLIIKTRKQFGYSAIMVSSPDDKRGVEIIDNKRMDYYVKIMFDTLKELMQTKG